MDGQRDLTLLTDFYQLTMMQGYFKTDAREKKTCFDLFFRENPFGSGYSITAGLEQALSYIKGIRFDDDALDYLKSTGVFFDDFLEYLRCFEFTGEIWAAPEGSVVFPQEPVLRVTAPIIEAQFVETALLNIINHQSLIATKASRVVWAAAGDTVSDFGLRRAQGPDAGIYGARAAYIGGVDSTSNVFAAEMFGIPVMGTQAHSWIMAFSDEYEAFKEFYKLYPSLCTMLVDTYDVLGSGLPAAIRLFDEIRGQTAKYGIRLDSGDLAYLSKKAREMLDNAGHEKAYISASGDLDEYLISQLKLQNAKINVWGVGTRLITAYDCPAFGGVYKMCAEYENGVVLPKMKISENPEKVTNPGVKKVYRIYDKGTGKMKADFITLEHEQIDENEDLTIFDPKAAWKRMTLEKDKYSLKELLKPVYAGGKSLAPELTATQIRDYCQKELNGLWDEHRRLISPHVYPVDLSGELLTLKESMIEGLRNL